MNLKDIMLSEISQPQKDKYCMIPHIWGTQKSQIHRQEVEWCLPGSGGRENGELVFNGYSFSFQDEMSSGNCLYNNVTVLNNIKLYT